MMRGQIAATRWFGICAAAALLAALMPATAPAATQIRMAAQENSEPKYIARNHNGGPEIAGLCVDIMRAIEQVAPEFKFVIDPEPQSLARIEAGLTAGKLDAACGFLRTEEREQVMRYVDPPLFSPSFYMVVRADDEIEVRNWDDVRRLGADGVILGEHACASVLRTVDGLQTDFSAKDPKTNVHKLLAGRGRFFFHRSPGIEEAIREAGAQEKVKILPAVMARQPLYMVLSKSVPAHTAEKLHRALSRLEANGELNKLLGKWSDWRNGKQ